MRTWKFLALAAAAGLIGCGGGGGGNGNPTGPPLGGATNGTFTATIGGANWGAIGQVAVNRSGNLIGLAGTGFAGGTTYALVLTIGGATGPGTHSLNATAGGDGSNLVVGSSTTAGWSTGFSGGTGTVTVTSLTANRIVGTFTATAVPSQGSTSNLVITNGKFDITF